MSVEVYTERKPGLSGFTVAKDCVRLDYCVEECVRSMLRVCDEVVVGYIPSEGDDDGTGAILLDLTLEDPRVRMVKCPDFTQAKGDAQWFVNWLNFTRGALRYDMMLQLDADEILDDRPAILDAIRNAARDKHTLRVDRLNYVVDPQHLIPEHVVCGKHVVRIGPSDLFLPSDEPRSIEEAPILGLAQLHPDIKIHHVGFLRPQDAFYAKAKVVLGAFFNDYDKRLADAEAAGLPFHKSNLEWIDRIVPYDGYIPPDVAAWMRARGFAAP
jgi:hypothetical protein